MLYNDASLAAQAIAAQIDQAERILILTHINPDGDAIGSMLGMWHALQSLGKHALPLASSPLPGYAQVAARCRTYPGVSAGHGISRGRSGDHGRYGEPGARRANLR